MSSESARIGSTIVGGTIVGGALGGVAGLVYGFATDTSDMPMAPVFTGPVGVIIGGLVGCIGAAVLAT